MNNNEDVPQSSAEAGKKLEQNLELLDLTCTTTTDWELVQDYLLPAIQRMREERSRPVVNAELPCMDPWELPGMIARDNKGAMRDNYFLTSHAGLRYFHTTSREIHTPNGFWKHKTSDTVTRAGHDGLVGVKTTMKYLSLSGATTNWIMKIYYSWNQEYLFLKADSRNYDNNPKCLGCHPGACNGNHSGQAFGAPINASFNSTHLGTWSMHHHDPERRSDPRLTSFIAHLENVLLGDLDPDNSVDTGSSSARRGDPPTADHGQSKKCKKISDVWDYFTKIFAHDINGKVLTFAACNHFCKILSGSSKGGTTHLERHTCPCKFKPAAAGRSAKDSDGDVNILSS